MATVYPAIPSCYWTSHDGQAHLRGYCHGVGLLRPYLVFIYLFILFWLCHMAFEILVPQRRALALEGRSLNHWTSREVPHSVFKHVV